MLWVGVWGTRSSAYWIFYQFYRQYYESCYFCLTKTCFKYINCFCKFLRDNFGSEFFEVGYSFGGYFGWMSSDENNFSSHGNIRKAIYSSLALINDL